MTAEQSIIDLLNAKIKEHEAKIISFRAAIKAIGGSSTVTSSPLAKRVRKSKSNGSANKKKTKTSVVSAKATDVKATASKATSVKKAVPVLKKKSTTPKKAKANKSSNEPTFESVVIGLLNDGVPKTSKSLLQLYNKATGKKLDAKGFSARLAIAKNRKNILSVTNSADTFLYNGKADWFEGGKMKKEYLSKLPTK